MLNRRRRLLGSGYEAFSDPGVITPYLPVASGMPHTLPSINPQCLAYEAPGNPGLVPGASLGMMLHLHACFPGKSVIRLFAQSSMMLEPLLLAIGRHCPGPWQASVELSVNCPICQLPAKVNTAERRKRHLCHALDRHKDKIFSKTT